MSSTYKRADFAARSIELKFVESDYEYDQFHGRFGPDLSIVDVLMFNDAQRIAELLLDYRLS